MNILRHFAFLAVLFSLGCATLPGGGVSDIHGRQVDSVLSGSEKPVVIFENGLGGKYDWWAKVYPEVAKSYTAFAYNRPGYGRSDSVATPRDAQNIVGELRTTLKALGLKPPYVLVGHSAGGLYFQYFARRYPEEVKGLVLVDSTHPLQMQGDGAVEKWPWWVRTIVSVVTPKAGKVELEEVESSGRQVLALPDLDTKKIKTVILLASEPENPSSPLEKHAVEMRQDFRRLYPRAKFITVQGSHSIPLHSPEVIIEQITETAK